jgi:hypothetical protein
MIVLKFTKNFSFDFNDSRKELINRNCMKSNSSIDFVKENILIIKSSQPKDKLEFFTDIQFSARIEYDKNRKLLFFKINFTVQIILSFLLLFVVYLGLFLSQNLNFSKSLFSFILIYFIWNIVALHYLKCKLIKIISSS